MNDQGLCINDELYCDSRLISRVKDIQQSTLMDEHISKSLHSQYFVKIYDDAKGQ